MYGTEQNSLTASLQSPIIGHFLTLMRQQGRHLSSIDDKEQAKLTHLIQHHRLESFLVQCPDWKRDAAKLSPNIQAVVRNNHKINVLRNLTHQSSVAKLASRFSAQEIRMLIVKGLAVQSWLYKGKVRPSHDVDIWVSQNDIAAASKLLQLEGFEPIYCTRELTQKDLLTRCRMAWSKDQSYYNPTTGVTVELHWRLTNIKQAFPLTFEQAWDARAYFNIAGREVATLAKQHHALFLCLHSAQSVYGRLFSLQDLALLSEVDPAVLPIAHELAIKWNCERAFICALVLACELYCVPLASSVHLNKATYGESVVLLESVIDEVLAERPIRPRAESSKSTFSYTLKIIQWNSRVIRLRFYFARAIYYNAAPKYSDVEYIALPSLFAPLYWIVRPYRLFVQTVNR